MLTLGYEPKFLLGRVSERLEHLAGAVALTSEDRSELYAAMAILDNLRAAFEERPGSINPWLDWEAATREAIGDQVPTGATAAALRWFRDQPDGEILWSRVRARAVAVAHDQASADRARQRPLRWHSISTGA
jgi:hypothetical protein